MLELLSGVFRHRSHRVVGSPGGFGFVVPIPEEDMTLTRPVRQAANLESLGGCNRHFT
jgi:hypothetical protein